MTDWKARLTTAKYLFAAILAGAALGWLTGLSRSSLLATLVPALLTALLGALPLVRVLRKDEQTPEKLQQELGAIAALVVGVALGTTASAYAVSRAMFSPQPQAYEALAKGIEDPEFKKKYLASLVTSLTGPQTLTAPPLQVLAGGRVRSQECQRALDALSAEGSDLPAKLIEAAEGDSKLKELIARTAHTAPGQLKHVVLEHCK